MTEDARGVYRGRSSEAEVEPGDPEEPTFAKALRAAYARGISNKPEGTGKTFKFKVVEVWVEGTNPITDYVVDVAG